jgi:hypothetical protein
MPPKKKLKPNLNHTSANPQTSPETDDRAARRATRQSAREDFDPPFDLDKDGDDFGSDSDGNDEETIDSDDSDEAREVRTIITRYNTFFNAGFKTVEGLQVAKHHPRNVSHLLTLARIIKNPALTLRPAGAPRHSPTDQDAPSEPVDAEE